MRKYLRDIVLRILSFFRVVKKTTEDKGIDKNVDYIIRYVTLFGIIIALGGWVYYSCFYTPVESAKEIINNNDFADDEPLERIRIIDIEFDEHVFYSYYQDINDEGEYTLDEDEYTLDKVENTLRTVASFFDVESMGSDDVEAFEIYGKKVLNAIQSDIDLHPSRRFAHKLAFWPTPDIQALVKDINLPNNVTENNEDLLDSPEYFYHEQPDILFTVSRPSFGEVFLKRVEVRVIDFRSIPEKEVVSPIAPMEHILFQFYITPQKSKSFPWVFNPSYVVQNEKERIWTVQDRLQLWGNESQRIGINIKADCPGWYLIEPRLIIVYHDGKTDDMPILADPVWYLFEGPVDCSLEE